MQCEVGGVSLRTMVQARGNLGAWGGPRIEWVDPQILGATPFILDDAAEEWLGFDQRLRGMVLTMDTALVSPSNAAEPCQV